jgi:ethanolamine utilization protein EutM
VLPPEQALDLSPEDIEAITEPYCKIGMYPPQCGILIKNNNGGNENGPALHAFGYDREKGLVGSIEAADAMVSRDVKLIGKVNVGGGLVTVVVRGDVGAVKSPRTRGRQAASRWASWCLCTSSPPPTTIGVRPPTSRAATNKKYKTGGTEN